MKREITTYIYTYIHVCRDLIGKQTADNHSISKLATCKQVSKMYEDPWKMKEKAAFKDPM